MKTSALQLSPVTRRILLAFGLLLAAVALLPQAVHAATPAESLAAVKKLVEQDKVFVLVLASGSTGAASRVRRTSPSGRRRP